jgi:hypothetical protein
LIFDFARGEFVGQIRGLEKPGVAVIHPRQGGVTSRTASIRKSAWGPPARYLQR